jgi:hypothetical protein
MGAFIEEAAIQRTETALAASFHERGYKDPLPRIRRLGM